MSTVAPAVLRSDLQRLADHTSTLKNEVEETFRATSAEQWLWSPDRNTWSMALVVEHLNSVGRQGLPKIEATLAQIRAEGALSNEIPRYGYIERTYIRIVSPNPPFRVPVPSVFVPKASSDPISETGPEFLLLLDRTLKAIWSANGLDLKKRKMESPVSPLIKFNVGAWMEALLGHNDYHWMQVRALRNNAQFPQN